MRSPIREYLTADHDRLDGLLERAVLRPGKIDLEAFGAFRLGLLRHIALEEKILLPAARAARKGKALPIARRLRVDHGAMTSLLVPTPSAQIVAEIRSILTPHNQAEEEPGGLYEVCDELLAQEAAEIVQRMRVYPEVKVAPYKDGPRVHRTAASALAASAGQLDKEAQA